VGFPGQSLGEVAESYRFLVEMARVGVDDVAVFPFVPYPGSELFAQLTAAGRITREEPQYERFLAANIYNEVGQMKSWSEHISDRQIKFLTVGGMAWFYAWQYAFRPQRALRTAYRLATSQPKTMIERALDGVIRNLVRGRKRGASQIALDDAEPMPAGAPTPPLPVPGKKQLRVVGSPSVRS
jgi:hypothetical protein